MSVSVCLVRDAAANSNLGTQPVNFFRCEDCGCVHAVEHQTPALEPAAKRKRA